MPVTRYMNTCLSAEDYQCHQNILPDRVTRWSSEKHLLLLQRFIPSIIDEAYVQKEPHGDTTEDRLVNLFRWADVEMHLRMLKMA